MKNKNITFAAFLKHQILSSFLSPVFIISAFVFVFYVFFNFFIKQQFFTGKGSADLTLLFSAIPYICIIVIPCLCWKKSDSVYDDFVPLSFFQKKLAYVLTYLINFVSILIFKYLSNTSSFSTYILTQFSISAVTRRSSCGRLSIRISFSLRSNCFITLPIMYSTIHLVQKITMANTTINLMILMMMFSIQFSFFP